MEFRNRRSVRILASIVGVAFLTWTIGSTWAEDSGSPNLPLRVDSVSRADIAVALDPSLAVEVAVVKPVELGDPCSHVIQVQHAASPTARFTQVPWTGGLTHHVLANEEASLISDGALSAARGAIARWSKEPDGHAPLPARATSVPLAITRNEAGSPETAQPSRNLQTLPTIISSQDLPPGVFPEKFIGDSEVADLLERAAATEPIQIGPVREFTYDNGLTGTVLALLSASESDTTSRFLSVYEAIGFRKALLMDVSEGTIRLQDAAGGVYLDLEEQSVQTIRRTDNCDYWGCVAEGFLINIAHLDFLACALPCQLFLSVPTVYTGLACVGCLGVLASFTLIQCGISVCIYCPCWPTDTVLQGSIFHADGTTPWIGVDIEIIDCDNNQTIAASTSNSAGEYSIVFPAGNVRLRFDSHCENIVETDCIDLPAGEVEVTPVSLPDCLSYVGGGVYHEDGVTPWEDVVVYALTCDGEAVLDATHTSETGSFELTIPSGDTFLLLGRGCQDGSLVPTSCFYVPDQVCYYIGSVALPVCENQTSYLEVHVYHSDAVTPWAGVQMVVQHCGGGTVASATTNSAGYADVSFPAGDVEIFFDRGCGNGELVWITDGYNQTCFAFPPGSFAGNAVLPECDETASIGGRILHENGATPWPDVVVSAQDCDTEQILDMDVTDGDGEYELVIPPGFPRDIRLLMDRGCQYGGMLETNCVELPSPGTYDFGDLILPDDCPPTSAIIEGVVFHEDGTTPWPGIIVSAQDCQDSAILATEITDGSGQYVLDIPPDFPREIRLLLDRGCPEGGVLFTSCVEIPGPDHYIFSDLVLPDACPPVVALLEGQVLHEDGVTPWPSVVVSVEDCDTGEIHDVGTTTSTGGYTLEVPPEFPREVRLILDNGCPPPYATNCIYLGGVGTYLISPLSLPDECVATLVGQIFHEDGATPWPDITVTAQDCAPPFTELDQTQTNAEGSYELDFSSGYPLNLRLLIERECPPSLSTNCVDVPGRGSYAATDLVLDDCCGVLGTVRDYDGTPLPGILVLLNGDIETYTDNDGHYGHQDLQCGLCYSVCPSAEDLDFDPSCYDYCPLMGVMQEQDFTVLPPSGVSDESSHQLRDLALHSCQPNPLSSSGWIHFDLPVSAPVKVRIFSASGRCVGTLVDGELKAGQHSIEWNPDRSAPCALEPGLYFVRLEALTECLTRKVLVVR